MGPGTNQQRWAEAPEGSQPEDNGGAGAHAGGPLPQAEASGAPPGRLAHDAGTPEQPPGERGPRAEGGTGGEAPEGAGDEQVPGTAGPTSAPAAEADLASLLVEVEHQRDEYLDALRRLQAEFDNYRKRMERHQREVADNAAGRLVKELLPVLDTADLALAHGGGEEVKHVAGALFDILSKQGLERIDPEGQPFDPEHHDAVAHEPAESDDTAEPLVSEVMRAGYRWNGRALRPAMVKVRG
ncbi:MAG: nucleotide exchange factor GrpE [Actinomycetota bacterium]|nr:nucleotide exchange factor GrpE [Actinomycetota bacterium]